MKTRRNLAARLRWKTAALLTCIALGGIARASFAQGEPNLVPDVVDYAKLVPLMPEPPAGWNAEKAEGSTTDTGEMKLTTVHRDYTKGTGDNAPVTSISILDTASDPEIAKSTAAGWTTATTTSTEGYSKTSTIDGNPAFEEFDNDNRHGSVSIIVAGRYLLKIETQGQDSKDLQEWLKRVDVKKLAAVK